MAQHPPRDALPFRNWSLAACAGLSLVGCPEQAPSSEATDTKDVAQPATVEADKKDGKCCMGLNECKGKGGCAVPESHACAGKNECKGQGGCNMHCPQ